MIWSHIVCLSLAFLGLGKAQQSILDELPSCAAECFSQDVGASTCASSDLACLCTDTAFLQAVVGCEALQCTVKEMLTATNVSQTACGIPQKSQSTTLIAVSAAFGSLAVAMVILRLLDRTIVHAASLGFDDLFVVIAAIFACPMTGTTIAGGLAGMGKNMWTLSFPAIDKVFLMLYLAIVFYMVAEAFVQLSLLAFYLRVFSSNGKFKLATRMLMGIVVSFGTANTLAMLLQCTPINFFWKGWAREHAGKCFNINIFSWARAGIEIAIDVAIISLPLPMLVRLQMSKRKKVQVLSMFCVGFVITLISILRLRSLVQFASTQNPTYENTPAIYWSVLECNMFIICACMPSMRALLGEIFPRLFGTSQHDSYYRQQRYGTGEQYERQESAVSSEATSSSQIKKTTGVTVHRSESDVELVDKIQPGQIWRA